MVEYLPLVLYAPQVSDGNLHGVYHAVKFKTE